MNIPPRAALALVLVLSAHLLPCTTARADQPERKFPKLFLADGGLYLFKSVPGEYRYNEKENKVITLREPAGTAYSLSPAGDLLETWRTQGWSALEAYLHEDGRYLVRIGPWAEDQKDHTDLAIAFYDRGKLLKQYEVRQLIRQPDLLEHSASHYIWRPVKQTRPTGFHNGTFYLVMVDKTAYSFSIETGKILQSGRDEGARSSHEIYAADDAAEKSKGQQLWDTSNLRAAFLAYFHVSDVRAMRGSYSGTDLVAPWEATLKPAQPLAHPLEAHILIPITDDQKLAATITPAQIVEAAQLAFQHPFIAARFQTGGATGLRMRLQGDRLHWDTKKLSQHLTQITGTAPADTTLAHWAEFILDAAEPRYTSLFLNTQTREILLEDQTPWPYVPYLLDAQGKRVADIKDKDKDK